MHVIPLRIRRLKAQSGRGGHDVDAKGRISQLRHMVWIGEVGRGPIGEPKPEISKGMYDLLSIFSRRIDLKVYITGGSHMTTGGYCVTAYQEVFHFMGV